MEKTVSVYRFIFVLSTHRPVITFRPGIFSSRLHDIRRTDTRPYTYLPTYLHNVIARKIRGSATNYDNLISGGGGEGMWKKDDL